MISLSSAEFAQRVVKVKSDIMKTTVPILRVETVSSLQHQKMFQSNIMLSL